MNPSPPRSLDHFTIFLSAADEAEMKVEREAWDNEGGQMRSTMGRVVCTPECHMPFKAVLTDAAGECTDHPFATVRQCEAFIRRHTPLPLFDRAPGQT